MFSVVKESLTTAADGKKYKTKFYNLDVIISNAPIIYAQLPHAVHDRYLIVDEDVWLLGTSVKDMGRSLCTVIKVGFLADQVMEMVNH